MTAGAGAVPPLVPPPLPRATPAELPAEPRGGERTLAPVADAVKCHTANIDPEGGGSPVTHVTDRIVV